MATDRAILKAAQAGAIASSAAVDAVREVANTHTRYLSWVKEGTENAATAVTERPGVARINRTSLANSLYFTAKSNSVQDTSNYATIFVYKRDSAGADQITLGSWNTHNSAQGTITKFTPAKFSNLVTNSQATLAIGANISYEIVKAGTGVVIDIGTFTFDVEET